MKLIKKLQIILTQNKKIIIRILISMILSYLSYFIFYLDLFDLNLFNKEDVIDLKTELLEKKRDLNLEKQDLNLEKQDLNLEENTKKDNNIYYLIAAGVVVVGALVLYYYFNNGANSPDLIKEGFDEMLSRIRETDQKYFHDKDTGRTGLLFPGRTYIPEEAYEDINFNKYDFFPTTSISSTDNYIRDIWDS